MESEGDNIPCLNIRALRPGIYARFICVTSTNVRVRRILMRILLKETAEKKKNSTRKENRD